VAEEITVAPGATPFETGGVALWEIGQVCVSFVTQGSIVHAYLPFSSLCRAGAGLFLRPLLKSGPKVVFVLHSEIRVDIFLLGFPLALHAA